MLVKICPDIFQTQKNFKSLNHLVQMLTYKGRHQLFVEYSLVKSLESFNRLDSDDRKIIEEQYNKFVLESSQPVKEISNEKQAAFNLEEATKFFQEKVYILLENSRNDAPFLNAIFRCFDKKQITRIHIDNNWLEFGNAGGKTNIPNWLSAKLRIFRNLPKENHHYLRIFVLMDSDKKYPTMQRGTDMQRVIDFLEENNISYHVLEKREMENYLPDEVIRKTKANSDLIEAYLRLSPLQKDFFDLEIGFPRRENFKDLDNEIKDLYVSLSDMDKTTFRVQSFSDLLHNFKSDFPRYFHDTSVTKETLQDRCSHHSLEPADSPFDSNELPNLVKRIIELL